MKEYLAEAIGTFLFVLIGAGAAIADIGLLGIALAHGLALLCVVYATGPISGGHINPAVTIGMFVTHKISAGKAVGYIIFQLIGSIVASVVLALLFTNSFTLATTQIGEGISPLIGVSIETLLTFFLVFTIFGVVVNKKAPQYVYGLAIGLALSASILFGGSFSGAALNPARSFGPALLSGMWINHWIYWVGPFLGGTLAALIYNNVLLKEEK